MKEESKNGVIEERRLEAKEGDNETKHYRMGEESKDERRWNEGTTKEKEKKNQIRKII